MTDFNETRPDAGDPRLTAYALGELEGEELARVAAAVGADPALQAAVDEVRDTAARLMAALEAEPLPLPAPPLRVEPYHTVRPARIFRWPYWGVAALGAAACLALVLIVRETPRARRPAPGLAETGGPGGAGGATAAGRVQPSNHVDIQFPGRTAEVAESEAAGDRAPWGEVVPNAPERKGPASPAAVAESPGRPAPGGAMAAGAASAKPRGEAGAVFDNEFVAAARDARSSFPVEVAAAGYADVRHDLAAGRRPRPADVRIEELVNYFTYDYAPPPPGDPAPIAASLEVASAPWAPAHRLVRIGLKGREAPAVIARDVQVQVEFNPALVQAYRLIGFENRPRRPGESGDRIDGRDLAAGRAVTALYEVIPVGEAGRPEAAANPVKYQQPANSKLQTPNSKPTGELLTVRVHYRPPEGGESRLLEFPLVDRGAAFTDASADFRFAAAVAGFGLILRESPHRGTATLAAVEAWAAPASGAGASGPRAEFLALVKRAEEVLAARG